MRPGTTATLAKPPSWLLTLAEGRSLYELAAFQLLGRSLRLLPRGDGHPVLFLPGFLASDASTKPMRKLFLDLGYDSHGWSLGRNMVYNAQREQAMLDLLSRVHTQTGRKVSIVGWSLGGLFAREIAKQHHDKVRCVISLGSPISNDRGHSNARHLFKAINGNAGNAEADSRFSRLDQAPPVPTTSIFSKTDGVVAWRGSVQAPGVETENIVVPASHLGLGVNPLVMVALADRLAQPEGQWRPFERAGWRRWLYRDVKDHAA